MRVMTRKLHTISEWENANTNQYHFDHVMFTKKSREVRVVFGIITINRRIIRNGKAIIIPESVKVRWDGYGHCWLGVNRQQRKRDYDIKFLEL